MPLRKSIPEKIISYLQSVLPAPLAADLYFDALALRGENLPTLVITACPSVGENRYGARVATNTRALKCYATLVWDAGPSVGGGSNYDEFEAAMEQIIDKIMEMTGSTIIGSLVLSVTIDHEQCDASLDIDSNRYIAEAEIMISYNT